MFPPCRPPQHRPHQPGGSVQVVGALEAWLRDQGFPCGLDGTEARLLPSFDGLPMEGVSPINPPIRKGGRSNGSTNGPPLNHGSSKSWDPILQVVWMGLGLFVCFVFFF